MTQDPEIFAMSELAKCLEPLDESARSRVISWAMKRFSIDGNKQVDSDRENYPDDSRRVSATETPNTDGKEQYEDFVDLYNEIAPEMGTDKVLISAYWFQEILGNPSFTSQEVHTELKKMNKGVTNITSTFSSLENQKPALVRQLNKAGKSKQARKTY